jgi:hypothetical protein
MTAMRGSNHLAAAFGLTLVVLAAYGNSFDCGLTLDNKFIIAEDPRLRQATGENLRRIVTEDYWWPKAGSGLYRPLTTLSFFANYNVFGNADRPAGYHLVNLGIHLGNAFLVYLLLRRLLGRSLPAWFAAALFSAHPIAVESVTNIVGRADLLAAAAVLGGLLMHIQASQTSGWQRTAWRAGLVLVSLAGVFCKENAMALMGVIVVYDFTYDLQPLHPNRLANLARNFGRFALRGYLLLLPAMLAFWGARQLVFSRLGPPEQPFFDNPLRGADFWTARVTAIKVVGKALALFVWPARLSCDYSYNQIPLVHWPWKTWKIVFFLSMFFFVTLAPTANLLVLVGAVFAERFLYLPLVAVAGGIVLGVAAGFRRVPRCSWAMPAVLVAILAACVARTAVRNRDWLDNVQLWTAAVDVCPQSARAHDSLAYALYIAEPDERPTDRMLDECRKAVAIQESLPVTQKRAMSYLYYGMFCGERGDRVAKRISAPGSAAESVRWYRQSVALLEQAIPIDRAYNEERRRRLQQCGRPPEEIPDVGLDQIYENLAVSQSRLGLLQDALASHRYQRHLKPESPAVYVQIARVNAVMGDMEEAAKALMQCILLGDSSPEHYQGLAEIYHRLNREPVEAVVATEGHWHLNGNCPIVARHFRAACVELVTIFLQAKQRDNARRIRDVAVAAGCPASALQPLFAETAPKNR